MISHKNPAIINEARINLIHCSFPITTPNRPRPNEVINIPTEEKKHITTANKPIDRENAIAHCAPLLADTKRFNFKSFMTSFTQSGFKLIENIVDDVAETDEKYKKRIV